VCLIHPDPGPICLYQALLYLRTASLGTWVDEMEAGSGGEGEVSFTAFSAAALGCLIVVSVVFVLASLRGSSAIHERMVKRVVAATLEWFESMPSGRILNRSVATSEAAEERVGH
jgi:ABC-type multidrug transport system fused ATPase/permease subunit